MPNVFPTRAEIVSNQLGQLRRLLADIIPANKFYAKKFAGLGKSGKSRGKTAQHLAISSLEDFSKRFPFTTKQELAADQLAHPPYGTNLTFPLSCYTRFHQTSGT